MARYQKVILDYITPSGRKVSITCDADPARIKGNIQHNTVTFYKWTFVGQREFVADNSKQYKIIK